MIGWPKVYSDGRSALHCGNVGPFYLHNIDPFHLIFCFVQCGGTVSEHEVGLVRPQCMAPISPIPSLPLASPGSIAGTSLWCRWRRRGGLCAAEPATTHNIPWSLNATGSDGSLCTCPQDSTGSLFWKHGGSLLKVFAVVGSLCWVGQPLFCLDGAGRDAEGLFRQNWQVVVLPRVKALFRASGVQPNFPT